MISSKYIALVIIVLIFSPISNAQAEDFQLNLQRQTGSVCPGKIDYFTFTVANTGSSEQEYEVMLSGSASQWATVLPVGFILKPGEKKTVNTWITPVSRAEPGIYTLTILVKNAQGVQKSVTYSLTVRDCFNFEVTSPATQEICPCAPTTYDFVIKNTGEFTETYSLEVRGRAQSFIALSEEQVTLQPGGSTIITASVAGLCDKGSFDFSLVVSSLRKQATASATITVVPCYDFSILSTIDAINMCDRTVETVPITLINEGNRDNTYELSIDGPAWANLESTGLALASGKSATVNLILSPDYNVQGDFTLTFTAIPGKGDFQAIKPFNVNIKSCHTVAINSAVDNETVCSGLSKSIDITARNGGELPNDFVIALDAPPWVSLDTLAVSLAAGEEQTLTLTAAPEADTRAARYDVGLVIESADKGFKAQDTLALDVASLDACYKPSLSTEQESLELAVDSSEAVPIVLKNDGLEAATFNLALTGDVLDFAQLSPETIELVPGAEETVYLYLAPSVDVGEGNYNAVITASVSGQEIQDTQSLSIKVSRAEEGLTQEELVEGNITNITGLEEITGQAIGEEGRGYGFYVWVGIIILVVLILFLVFRKRFGKFFEEDWEKELKEMEEKKPEQPVFKEEKVHEGKTHTKIFVWALAVLILAVLIYLGWRYSIAAYIVAYRLYLILGVVILIILALLIKYRKNIMEFFEEEKKEEPPKEEVQTEPKMSFGGKKEEPQEHKHMEHKETPEKHDKPEKKEEKKSDEEQYY